MKGPLFIQRWITTLTRGLTVYLCVFSFFISNVVAQENVLVIKSNDNRFFDETITYLIQKSPETIKFSVELLNENGSNITEKVAQSSLLITLGLKASQWARTKYQNKATINAYLTKIQSQRLKASDSQTAVYLDQPLSRYIRFAELVLPEQKNNLALIDTTEARLASQEVSQGVKLYHYQPEENVVNLVRSILQDNRTLISTPIANIYNNKTLKGILLAAYRKRAPILSYSSSHVKSGALAAIYASPKNIGHQLTDMTLEFFKSGYHLPKENQFAKYYSIAINDRVARALQISLEKPATIIKKLQKRQP